MGNVYIEPRPEGRHEGTAIEDYVIEDHKDHVLKTFKTRRKPSIGRKQRPSSPRRPREAREQQDEARSLALGLGNRSPRLDRRPAPFRRPHGDDAIQ
jgi:hypothetical protein